MQDIPSKVWYYVVAIATGILFVALSDLPLWPPSWWRPAAIAVSMTVLLHFVWDRLLWRIPLVQKISGRPDVRGTWKGRMRSQYHTNLQGQHNEDCKTGVAELDAYVVIRQTASRIRVTLLAERSQGSTTAYSHYGDGSRAQAIVVYQNVPQEAGVLIAHHGASIYTLQANGKRIEFRHWTDRFTRGHFAAETRVAQYADSYDQARRMFA